MFEEYIGKKVKIYTKVGDQSFKFTGKIQEVSETHIKLIDKFDKEQLILIENIEQATLEDFHD